ncbi:hypothetical protein KY289_020040 [Solanum tuberosum]|nr:hypothetical protein KY289_020040 [Solanum tuberosum]
MTEASKRLNTKVEALLQENAKLMEQVKSFKGKDSIQQIHTSTQTSEPSFPSQDKMDEQGVHSPTNAKRSTVSDNKDTASPVQTAAGKDTSNSFMAVTLPKSEGEGSSSRRRSLSSGEEDYGEHSYYQDAQDPNEDDDSGMSFDSIALHNLDT